MNRVAVVCFTVILGILFEAQASTGPLARQKRSVACGTKHIDAPGTLKSPHHPASYPGDTDCSWIISTTEGKIISVKFTRFELESHADCDYDYLEIYDGDVAIDSKKLGRFCGTRLPKKITSAQSKLLVVFHSDAGVEAPGFAMSFSTSYGCDRVFTEDSGEIVSPNHPGKHPQPTQCNYKIIASRGKAIHLTFVQFSLEDASAEGCEYDYVEVYDGPTVLFPRLGRFCGSHKPSVKPSTNNRILVRFVADASVRKAGFRLVYQAKGPTMNEICIRPAYTGDCRADFRRWFYNTNTRQCQTFSYGGCNSNGNNFRTKEECERKCKGDTAGDFNECSKSNGGCDQACHNTLGSFFCSCWKGYKLGNDQRKCEDVDECALGRQKHHCEHNCQNVPGSHYCTCREGFQLSANRRTCNDIDECLVGGKGACQQECANTPGGYKCKCFKGFEPRYGDPKHCKDINECELDLPDCHRCFNTEGSHRCECNPGFVPSENKTSCLDINECLKNNGGCSQLCINQPGNYSCRCKPGFYPKDPGNLNCEDIDECSGNNGKGNCEYKCTNSIGSFNCSCPEGYQLGEDELSCIDIDECQVNNGGCIQKCVNLPATYKCVCHDGYEKIGKNGSDVICKDIDECSVGSHLCDTDLGATCVNEIGNYSCTCPPGYYSDWNKCIDVDECKDATINYCAQHCNNTPGSFHCSCFKGFTLNSDNETCSDIDECASSPCDHNCVNIVGSFICLCKNGYYLDKDQRTCLDINECEENNGFCNHICINTNGSHKCECRAGYKLLQGGVACMDIDECSEGTACCDSTCTNEDGGYKCGCHEGHFMSRDNCTCQDRNECSVNNGGCDHICNNTKGGFSCSCRPGYEIDPTNASRCLDINECLQNNGGCSQICNNTKGSHECHCRPVFKLAPDGKTCDHCPSCENFEELINLVEKLQMEVQSLKEWKDNFLKQGQKGECTYKGQTYSNNDNWDDGRCRRCFCQKGQVLCFQDKKCFNSGPQRAAMVNAGKMK